MRIMCALTSMQLLGCVASCVVMTIDVTTALTEEDHTYFPIACRHPHSPRLQVGCKMAALWYLPLCGVPSLGSHSTRQGRKPRRLHAGPAEQVDLQPGRNGDPPRTWQTVVETVHHCGDRALAQSLARKHGGHLPH